MRIVSRPGLERFAGPTPRQLLIARWIPLIVPVVFQGIDRLGIHLPGLFFLVTAAALLLSARTWLETGSGLSILVFVQLLAAGAATLLLLANFFSPASWLFYSSATALMMGYTAWVFNVIGSLLPR